MKSKFFVLGIILFITVQVSSQNYYNMFPNYQPGTGDVINYITRYTLNRNEISNVIPLQVNGDIRKGSVKSKWDNKADIDLYEIKVYKEGVLSIVAKPMSYDNKRGTLSLQILVNENRKEGGVFVRARSGESSKSYRRDNGWSVFDSYSFYAYPGTYYLKVDGKYGDVKGKHDYIPLTYQIGVIQDDNVNSYVGRFSKKIGTYNPNDLGSTVLNNSVSITSSLNMEHWFKRSKNKILASKSAHNNVNSYDNFNFTATKTGKVYLNISTFTTNPLKVWHRAWRKGIKKDNSPLPLFTVQVSGNQVKPINNSTGKGYINVIAGKNYRVTIRSSHNRPAYYKLDVGYL